MGIAGGFTPMTESSFAATSNMAGQAMYKDNLDGSRTLLGAVPTAVTSAKLQYHAGPTETLGLRVIMPLRPGVEDLIKNLYDPQSPIYHDFLTPGQFAQQFSPAQADTEQVRRFLIAQGLSVENLSANGVIWKVTGPVRKVEKAFKLHINHYMKTDGTRFFAPDADPTIPVQVVGRISAIAGLDNVPRFKPLLHQRALTPKNSPKIGTGPLGLLLPSDIAKAYNLNGIPSNNGPTQNVGLFELDGYNTSDIAGFLSYVQLPNSNINTPCNYTSSSPSIPINFNNPPNGSCSANILQNVLVDGFNGNPLGNGGSVEVTLDIEAMLGLTPNAINKVYVYEADQTTNPNAWIDEWTQIATDDQVKIISCSWGSFEHDPFFSAPDPGISFDNTIFAILASQGQEVFVASGDDGTVGPLGHLLVGEPAAQPYVTGVGISTLSLNPDDSYNAEVASVYGGAGISTFQSIPSYQQQLASVAPASSKVSITNRNTPDVVLTADPSSSYSFYVNGGWEGLWGSSIAAPQWAAFNALVNQGLLGTKQSRIGFVNPLLYTIAQGGNYPIAFHDIISGSNSYYPAGPGYDLATGLGSFNGQNLYSFLVSVPLAPVINVTPGNSSVSLSWKDASQGILTYNIKRSINFGGPFAAIATGVTNSNYTDTSVVAGATYYYEVSAVNAIGEGPASTIASTPGPAGLITASAGTGGVISPNGVLNVSGATKGQAYTITPNSGYSISQLLVDGVIVPTSLSPNPYTYTFTNFSVAHTIQASFVQIFTISLTAGPGGTISPSGTFYLAKGAFENIYITMNDISYSGISQFLDNGVAVTLPAPTDPYYDGNASTMYSLSNISASHTISVTFVPIYNVITASVNGAGGTISPSGPVNVLKESSQTYTVTPAPGYGLNSILIDGNPANFTPYWIYYQFASTSPVTFTLPYIDQPHTIQASFVQLFNLTLSANAGCTIQPFGNNGVSSVYDGESTVLTINNSDPWSNYILVELIVDGKQVPTPKSSPDSGFGTTTWEYIFQNINANHTVQAVCSLPTNTITASARLGGTISPSGAVTVNAGQNQSFTITPNTGYSISTVTDNGANVTGSLSGNTYSLNFVTEAHAIIASFRTSDGATLYPGTGGALITSDGTWTFSATSSGSVGNYYILLNGSIYNAAGGYASMLLVNQGKLYAYNGSANSWWWWNGSGWTGATSDPRGSQGAWGNLIGVTGSGGNLTKTAATGWGNGGAVYTKQITTNGSVQFQSSTVPGNPNSVVMAGFIPAGSAFTNTYTGFSYSIVLKYNQEEIYEGPYCVYILKTPYNANDTYSVVRKGSIISYVKISNNTSTTFYTSNTPASGPLVAATAIYDNGGTITNITVSGT